MPKTQKLYLTTISLEGETESWYLGFIQDGQELTLEGFVDEIIARFSPET